MFAGGLPMGRTIDDFRNHLLHVAGVKKVSEFAGSDIPRIMFMEKIHKLARQETKGVDYKNPASIDSAELTDLEWDMLESELLTLLGRLN